MAKPPRPKKIRVKAEEITVEELQEGNRYGLRHATHYATIKENILNREREKLVNSIEDDVRDKIREELKADDYDEIRNETLARLEIEFSGEKEKQIRAEIRAEVCTDVPSDATRQRFSDYYRSSEKECLTMAEAASVQADNHEDAYRRKRRWQRPVRWISFFITLQCAVMIYLNWGPNPALWIQWAVFTVFAFLFWAFFTNNTGEIWKAHYNEVHRLRKVTSDYWELAEWAKRNQMVWSGVANSIKDLKAGLYKFKESKSELDSQFTPKSTIVQKARVEVTSQIMSEIDPDKIFRVEEVEEFEEKLAESKRLNSP